jgi:hypothetical protein
MTTESIARRLVELVRSAKFDQVYDELFADDAKNIEMPATADGPLGNADGLAAMRKKSADWFAAVEQMHSFSAGDPIVAGNWFALPMKLDVTFKGQGRTQMEEICVYGVKNGKIVLEQFFYDAG